MMQWESLLSLRRQGDVNKRIRLEQDERRLGFEVDYDRVIFSSAFRSLQDKTQVIPMSKTSFVHTRLTHSLEVSVVGRSLGRIAGKTLLERHPNLQTSLGYQLQDFGAIVAAAALAHDIGNPPFGHSGEKAIGEYFSNGAGKRFKDRLTDKQYTDLVRFEGNAHGFQLLTASRHGVTGGLRLSYATLGAFLKYPKESLPHKPTPAIADKKYGIFQGDVPFFQEVVADLGLLSQGDGRYCRHPLAYLVEAADDICYTIIDFEDGINLGLIEEDHALEYLIKLVQDRINLKKYHGLDRSSDRLAYLRSLAISTLIEEAVRIFLQEEESIMNGTLAHGLLDKSRYEAQIADIIKVSVDKVYRSQEVIEKELAGYTILNELLDHFTGAMERDLDGNATHRDRLLLDYAGLQTQVDLGWYGSLMQVCSWVAGLTDGNSLQIYRKITGTIQE